MSSSSTDSTARDAQIVGKMVLLRTKMKSVSAEELRVFYNIIRIINSLRSVHKLQIKLDPPADRLERVKDRVDLHFYAISLYYSAMRSFTEKLANRINPADIEQADRGLIETLCERMKNRKTDAFLETAAIVRDKVMFHFDEDIIEKYIIEGEPERDLVIGYTRGHRILDCVYLEPYSSILHYLVDNIPGGPKWEDLYQWIEKTSVAEIDSFCHLLERIAGRFFRRNGAVEPTTIDEMAG